MRWRRRLAVHRLGLRGYQRLDNVAIYVGVSVAEPLRVDKERMDFAIANAMQNEN